MRVESLVGFLMSLLVATSAAAQPKVCRAPFAIQQKTFPCDAFFQSLDNTQELRIAFLYNTFNNGGNCLNRVMQDPRLRWMEIILINESCSFFNRCGDYEFLKDMNPTELDRAFRKRDPAFIAKYRDYITSAYQWFIPQLKENVQCAVSPFLESLMSPAAATIMLEETRKVWGDRCSLVWNPKNNDPKRSANYGQDLLELHGATAVVQKQCIVNLDGTDIDFAKRPAGMNSIKESEIQRFIARYQDCEAVCLWVGEDNCAGSTFVDPRARICRDTGVFALLGTHVATK